MNFDFAKLPKDLQSSVQLILTSQDTQKIGVLDAVTYLAIKQLYPNASEAGPDPIVENEGFNTITDNETWEPAVPVARRGSKIDGKCPVGTKIQSVLLSKNSFDLLKARKWINNHNFELSIPDVTEQYYRFRQFEPSNFRAGSFRTIELDKGIKAIVACPMQKAEQGAKTENIEKGVPKMEGPSKNALLLAHNFEDKHKWGELGIFAGKYDYDLRDFGPNSVYLTVNPDAKILRVTSSQDYLENNGLINEKIDPAKFGDKTYEYAWDDTGWLGPDTWYYSQKRMIKDLKEKGYQFDIIHYLWEDTVVPEQYQILNEKMVDFYDKTMLKK